MIRGDGSARPSANEKDDVGVGSAEVLAGQPEVGEPAFSPEGDLAPRRAHLDRAQRLEGVADSLEHGHADRMAGDEVFGVHRSRV